MIFDLPALYHAMDERRQAQRQSWSVIAGETGVAAGTLKRTCRGGAMEAGGILALTDWLGVAPEQFYRSGYEAEPSLARARRPAGQLDTRKLHAVLDRRRREQGMGWADLAVAVGPDVSAAMLTRLAKGGRANIQLIASCAHWLGMDIVSFRTPVGRKEQSDSA